MAKPAIDGGLGAKRGRVLLAVREMLLRGEIQGGQRIEEVVIGRGLGASKPMLRSVLERLESEGLVAAMPGGGFSARAFATTDLMVAIAIRGAIEGMAASAAARRRPSSSELARVRQINQQLAQASVSVPPTWDEMQRFGELNAEFHHALVGLAKCPMFHLALERIQSMPFASPAAVVIPRDGNGALRAVTEHETILAAIESGDGDLAEALVRQHSELAAHGLRSAMQRDGKARGDLGLALVRGSVGQETGPASPIVDRPKPVPQKGETSERMLDLAAALFCEKGFHATSTRELASRLGMHQASLYHHVASKEQLLYRISRHEMNRFLEQAPNALGRYPTGKERLGRLIQTHVGLMLDHPERSLAMVTEYRALSRPHQTELAILRDRYSDLLHSEIQAMQGNRLLRDDIGPRYLRLALLDYLNWAPRWFRAGGPLTGEELASICERIFWDGVASRGSGESIGSALLDAAPTRTRLRSPGKSTLGRFIHTAAEMFAKQGYASTTTRSMANLLGVEKATLYYHVAGKEDLLYAICKASIETLTADVDRALEGIESPMERLATLIRVHCTSMLRDQTQHATALAEVRALSQPRLAEIVSMRKAYREMIRATLDRGQSSGQIRSDISSRYLGLMLEGLLDSIVIWYRPNGELNPAQLAANFGRIYLFGASRRNS